MKSELRDKDPVYPRLEAWVNKKGVVLKTADETGTVVFEAKKEYGIGHYSDGWTGCGVAQCDGMFVVYTGEVVLC